MAALSTLALAAIAGSTAVGLYTANEQKQAQREAASEAKKAAATTEQQAQQANNKANQKAPDMEALLKANTGKGGASGTMLTGPAGIDPTALALGKNTLLGQ
jgi:flagellar biosynthesis component FlhA